MVAAVLSACSFGCPLDAEAVRSQLEKKLSIGDDRDRIETVLSEEGISFSYDNWSNEYYSTIRDEENCGRLSLYKALSVVVRLDDDGRFIRLTVKDSYTFL